MEVPREEDPKAALQQQKQKAMLGWLDQAAAFYSAQLQTHSARKGAIQYLKRRGLSGSVVQQFQIGLAPAGWQHLLTALNPDQDPGITQALVESGLVVARDDGKLYDRFRERIMFPIRDERGRMIGFGGRVMGDAKPKYLNSPETSLFQKSRELYGLYEALNAQRQPKQLLVVEGYLDVISLHQFGLPNAVATLGTATSETHLLKMFRHTQEVVFCFDGDAAGYKAALRALETALGVATDGRSFRFLLLPDGSDPDSLIRSEGLAAFQDRINDAPSLSDFLLNHWSTQVDLSTLDGRAQLVHLALPHVQRLPNDGILQNLVIQKLAELTEVTSTRLLQQLQQLPHPNERPAERPASSIAADPMVAVAPEPSPEEPSPVPGVRARRRPSADDLAQTRQPPPWQKAMALLLCWPALAHEIDLAGRELPDSEPTLWLKKMLEVLQKNSASHRYAALDILSHHGFEDLLRGLSRTEYFAILTQESEPSSAHRILLEELLHKLSHEPHQLKEYEQLRAQWLHHRAQMSPEAKTKYLTMLKDFKNKAF
jgi:DNA primase